MSAVFQVGKSFLPVTPIKRTPQTERALPSLPRQAVNFGRALVRSQISQMRGNPRNVSSETKRLRREKCISNSCGFYRASDGRCAHIKCGCPVSRRGLIESKTEIFAEMCPADPPQWGPGEITT